MLGSGMIEETKTLLEKGYGRKCPALQGLGYKHILGFLDRQINRETMRQLIIRDTRRYAKRQMTWFRRNSRIDWIDRGKLSEDGALHRIIGKLNGKSTTGRHKV